MQQQRLDEKLILPPSLTPSLSVCLCLSLCAVASASCVSPSVSSSLQAQSEEPYEFPSLSVSHVQNTKWFSAALLPNVRHARARDGNYY